MDFIDEHGYLIEIGDTVFHPETGDAYILLGLDNLGRLMTSHVDTGMRVSWLTTAFNLEVCDGQI
jgi:hypothetical protein